MGAFLKTFFVCLLLTLGFIGYKYFSGDSFSPDLKISDNSPVFGVHKQPSDDKKDSVSLPDNIETPDKTDNQEPSKQKPEEKKYTHTCYFYSVNGKLIPVKRETAAPLTLENTVNILLRGPVIAETKKGIYSEIPANVDLINIQRKNNSVIINLSSNFGQGGGSDSIENRVKQLSKTVKAHTPGKNIYLYINGQEVEYLGGDGVYIKQPLE